MCGIVGFTGTRPAAPLLVEGLARLEYRGYDSSGLATLDADGLHIRKRAGRIAALQQVLARDPAPGPCGISHTRWATHGAPSDVNSHPHLDQSGHLAVVHNGVIENYAALKARLEKDGHTFQSETDTEVLAHLIGTHYDALPPHPDRLLDAVRAALPEVRGTYGIGVLHANHPGELVGARRGSPLVIGLGDGEYFLASDVTPLVAHTRDVVYLNDYDIVHLTPDGYRITSLTDGAAERNVSRVDWDAAEAERGDFPHYMLKEIFEQPAAIENALRGRLDLENATANFGGLNLDQHALRRTSRILHVACGSALHASRTGEYLIEELAQIPVDCDFASEFRYRNSPMDSDTIAFVVSQSGETADSLAAMREVRRKGVRALGIVNTVGSTIARESDGGIYLHAGPEIGVAATKSFVAQCTVFALLALYFGRTRHLSARDGRELIAAFQTLPDQVRAILERNEAIRRVAEHYAAARSMLFLGRLANYPIALEGALKLKEISYIHAEALPAAELKHGVIALVSPEVPTVLVAPEDGVHEKNLATLQEIKARGGPVIAVATEGDTSIAHRADHVLWVPRTHDILQPILNVVPLQLFAYHLAVLLGCDVDKPRNLAKSVTVE
jgi:glucosamine--fructose-6-phosphate aminotransferase (isomerizing)